MGFHMSIDETSLTDGEIYTILSNKAGRGRKGSIAAIVKGTRQEDVIAAINSIPEPVRTRVGEITMDFASSMCSIAQSCFPWANRVIDRFHMQKLVLDDLQGLRIAKLKEARSAENRARKKFRTKEKGRITRLKKAIMYSSGEVKPPHPKPFTPERLSNGDTVCELLTRSRYLLMVSADRWSDSQKERAQLLFSLFPTIKKGYGIVCSLRSIFNNKEATKESARESLSRWYALVKEYKQATFKNSAETIKNREEEVLNYFINRSTNASAESLNTKIKTFRAQLRGIIDVKFFLFRLSNVFS